MDARLRIDDGGISDGSISHDGNDYSSSSDGSIRNYGNGYSSISDSSILSILYARRHLLATTNTRQFKGLARERSRDAQESPLSNGRVSCTLANGPFNVQRTQHQKASLGRYSHFVKSQVWRRTHGAPTELSAGTDWYLLNSQNQTCIGGEKKNQKRTGMAATRSSQYLGRFIEVWQLRRRNWGIFIWGQVGPKAGKTASLTICQGKESLGCYKSSTGRQP